MINNKHYRYRARYWLLDYGIVIRALNQLQPYHNDSLSIYLACYRYYSQVINHMVTWDFVYLRSRFWVTLIIDETDCFSISSQWCLYRRYFISKKKTEIQHLQLLVLFDCMNIHVLDSLCSLIIMGRLDKYCKGVWTQSKYMFQPIPSTNNHNPTKRC